jgi:hypothetical protein
MCLVNGKVWQLEFIAVIDTLILVSDSLLQFFGK